MKPWLLASLLFLLPLPAQAALTFIASDGNAPGSNGSTVTCASTLNLSAADTVAFAVGWEGGTTTVSVAKDSGSPANTATCATPTCVSTDTCQAICYLDSASADASAKFKATLGVSRTAPAIVAMQFRGGMTHGNTNNGSGTTGTPSSGTIATTTANSVVVGFVTNNNGTATANESINSVAADANPQDLTQISGFYRIVSSTFAAGAATVTSFGGGVQWVAGIRAFDEGAAPPPTCAASSLLLGVGCK